jgi:hypothetical protein
MRSYRIRLSDWLHLKAHAVQHISSASSIIHPVLGRLSPKKTGEYLARAAYAD